LILLPKQNLIPENTPLLEQPPITIVHKYNTDIHARKKCIEYKNALGKKLYKYYCKPLEKLENSEDSYIRYVYSLNNLNKAIDNFIKDLPDNKKENTIYNIIEMTQKYYDMLQPIFKSLIKNNDRPYKLSNVERHEIFKLLNDQLEKDSTIKEIMASNDNETIIILENIIAYVKDRLMIYENVY
jgi:hypothetical protein